MEVLARRYSSSGFSVSQFTEYSIARTPDLGQRSVAPCVRGQDEGRRKAFLRAIRDTSKCTTLHASHKGSFGRHGGGPHFRALQVPIIKISAGQALSYSQNSVARHRDLLTNLWFEYETSCRRPLLTTCPVNAEISAPESIVADWGEVHCRWSKVRMMICLSNFVKSFRNRASKRQSFGGRRVCV
jgi:hypothetical protein